MQKAIFFDRDGVLNKEIGDYVTNEQDFELLPDAVDCIKLAIENGYLALVITNQGGIAKKLYDSQLVNILHQKIQTESGNLITEFFYCPHHQSIGKCICRKPDSLMLEKALSKYNILASKSLMIGDTDRDMEAAKKVGLNTLLIQPNSNKLHLLLNKMREIETINR
jgi:D-glycero-D-manno-heptose 1,7-bisphosphate phosphatase